MSIISTNRLKAASRLLFLSPLALGDFLYIKTFIIALKKQYPHIEIDIWLDDNRCNTDSWRLSRSKILQQWIESEGCFTRSYGCTDSVEASKKQIQQAKEYQYDLIFCHSVSKSKQYSQIARTISPTAFIVSSLAKRSAWGLFDKVLYRHSDRVFSLNPNELASNHHITDRYENVFNHVAGLKLAKEALMPELVIPSDIEPVTDAWLSEQFTDTSKQGPLIFLNHLSTNTKKDWQLSQLFELIEQISADDVPYRFVINVTKENYQQVSSSTQEFLQSNQHQVAVFTVQEHFFELPSLIARADFVITVDTAILHFAFAAKRPLLSMMRQKKPYWAPPASPTSHVLYATEGKGHISDISVETVYQQYMKMTVRTN